MAASGGSLCGNYQYDFDYCDSCDYEYQYHLRDLTSRGYGPVCHEFSPKEYE